VGFVVKDGPSARDPSQNTYPPRRCATYSFTASPRRHLSAFRAPIQSGDLYERDKQTLNH